MAGSHGNHTASLDDELIKKQWEGSWLGPSKDVLRGRQQLKAATGESTSTVTRPSV
jgi:hypothetical protein